MDHMMGMMCEEMLTVIKAGLVKLSAEGKLRLSNGSYIPNFPNAINIKDRVEKYYAKKQSQFLLGKEDEENVPKSLMKSRGISTVEDSVSRKALLKYELDLKEQEEALELKQLKLEQEERHKEQNNKTTLIQCESV